MKLPPACRLWSVSSRPWIACVVVSIFVLSCASPTRGPREPASEEPSLVVMTYNVNYGVAGDEATLGAVGDSGADLVLLQETTPKWEHHLADLADIYPHMDFHHCCGAGGLAILSKHPIADERLEPLDAEVRAVGHSDHRPVLATFVLTR